MTARRELKGEGWEVMGQEDEGITSCHRYGINKGVRGITEQGIYDGRSAEDG